MDLPTTDVKRGPEKIEDEKEKSPLFHCDLFDTEVVHKLAQILLTGLATACVDNTSGDLFKTPGSVAVDLRKDMIDYLTQRSELFVAESVILEGDPEGELLDHPFDIISCFVDDFASLKRNLFSWVSGWLLSESREDKIDDFVQEMEMDGFWLLEKRKVLAQTLLKNVDFRNLFQCSMKFNSLQELANHVNHCSFRSIICQNQGCDAIFCASHLEKHDSTCPFKMIPCEQNCSGSIMRREMDRHCITVCPMKLVNCPFYAAGCRSAIAQSMINKHCSDNLHSHLLYILQSIYKKASEKDLKGRVEQILQESSNNQLAEAQGVRSLQLIVKDIESKLEPLEISAKKKKTLGNIADKEGNEDVSITIKGNGQHTQTSNEVNSSAKVEVNAIVNKDSAENTAINEDSKCSHIKTRGGNKITRTSDMAILSVEAEVGSLSKENVEIYSESKDSNSKINENGVITQIKKSSLSDKVESVENKLKN